MERPSAFPARAEMPALVLLALACVFLYADQNLMAPNLSAIADYAEFYRALREAHGGA